MIMNIKTNHAITALICGIFPGGGQFYNRQIVKGLIFFVFLVSFFSCSKDLITHGLWGLVTLGEELPRYSADVRDANHAGLDNFGTLVKNSQ